MRHVIFSVMVLWLVIPGMAQIKAITETGEEVILFNNGTWEHVRPIERKLIPTNKTSFKKPKSSTFMVKSKILGVGFNIDPQQWSFKKGENNDASEFEFQLRGKDVHALAIVERLEIPLETLRTIALENARSIAPDTHIVHEEYRTVNDNKVLYMQLNGTIQGIKFTYLAYYYSNTSGSVQLVTYTAQNLVEEFRADIEDFLNGFEVIR